MSSDLRGILFFIFLGKEGKGEREWEGANVNWGFEGSASYQQVRGGGSIGDKSGIWRFYRRVWKNIFYEWGDKERKRVVLRWIGVGKRKRGKDRGIFGLWRGRDDILNI